MTESMMPPAVTTCTVNFGEAISFLGAGAAINVTLSAVVADDLGRIVEATIVHAATGVALYSGDDALVTSANGDPISFVVPHVDQDGFIDGTGSAVTFWAYKLSGTIAFGKKKVTVSKTFQPVVGQTTLDLDLLPDGAAAATVSAPTPTIYALGEAVVASAAEAAISETNAAASETAAAGSASAAAGSATSAATSATTATTKAGEAAASATAADTSADAAAASETAAAGSATSASSSATAASGSATLAATSESNAADSAADAEASAAAAAAPTAGQMATVDADAGSTFRVQQDARLSATYVGGVASAKAAARRALGIVTSAPQTPLVSGPIHAPSHLSQDGQAVHPSVVDAGAGLWNGFRYWMAATPFPYSSVTEDPSIYCSTDGVRWQVPTGLTNPVDTSTFLNSDPELLLVGGTMYLWYREHSSAPPAAVAYEKILLRTSTDGITWSAEQVVLDTTPNNFGDRLRMLSPAVVHTGSQFIMFASNRALGRIERRTSSDGLTWSAPTTVTMDNYTGAANFSHVGATRATDGRVFLFLHEEAADGVGETPGVRRVWLGRSSDAGVSFSYGAGPLLDSRGMANTTIYRTVGLHSTVNGLDYFRVWYSGWSDASTWQIGYTEGYAPDVDAPLDSLVVPGNVEAKGDLSARGAGFRRVYTRLFRAVRAQVSVLFSNQHHTGWTTIVPRVAEKDRVYTEGPYAELGYTSLTDVPPLLVTGRDDAPFSAGAAPGFALHYRCTDIDATVEKRDAWLMRAEAGGKNFIIGFWDKSASLVKHLTLSPSGDVAVARNLTGLILKGTTGVGGTAGDFGPGADGTNDGTTTPLRVRGNNIRILTASTPTSSADATGLQGEIRWDANYLYVKTATGAWKRVALTTW